MKTSTTKLTALALTLGTLIILTSAFKTQQSGGKYITMRTSEIAMGALKIIIAYPNGETEELELKKLGHEENPAKINSAINMISKKGFELVSSCGGEYVSTYVFVQK